jgi:hypothetical protein
LVSSGQGRSRERNLRFAAAGDRSEISGKLRENEQALRARGRPRAPPNRVSPEPASLPTAIQQRGEIPPNCL